MSRVKLNLLHLHLSDSQSWPLEIEQFPELSQKAAYVNPKDGKPLVYSRETIRDLVAYAKQRGVRIMPEVDTPGHAPFLFGELSQDKYGTLTQCSGTDQYSTPAYANEPPSGQWNMTEPKTLDVLSAVFTQMSQDFSTAPYLHIGSDEINVNCTAVGTEFEHSDFGTKKEYTKQTVQSFISALQ